MVCRGPPMKPLIAAVEGFALAGGCEIAIASDLSVAGQAARFGLSEVALIVSFLSTLVTLRVN